MLAALRSGSFVTRGRMRGYCMLLLAAYVVAIGRAAGDGRRPRRQRRGVRSAPISPTSTPPASWRTRASAALAYDLPAHHDMQRQISGRADIPYYGWHYPPAFLLLAAALAVLPYLGALLVYQAATLVAYLAVVRQIAGRAEAWLPALAFPAVFVNVTHGHNGFITAALLGGALLVLDRRPLAGRRAHGLPRLQAAVRAAGAAGARGHRALAHDRRGGAQRVLAIAGLTWAAFGADVFAAFWQSLAMTRRVILEGAPGFHKIQSVYAALRLLGVPGAAANAAQVLTTLGVARGAGGAVALGGGLRAEGGGAADRQRAGDALRARLRPRRAGAGHRLPGRARPAAGLCALRGLPAGGVVGAAVRGALDRRGDGRVADAARADRGLRPDPAAGGASWRGSDPWRTPSRLT